MDKGKSGDLSVYNITSSLNRLQLNSGSISKAPDRHSALLLPSHWPPLEKVKARSLVSLCLGVLGQNLEYIISDLSEIAPAFPPDIKKAIAAIARRRKLLNDDVLVALIDNSWDILDISGSDVTDYGLATVAEICTNLRVIDISRCVRISASAVSDLASCCRSLEILRCGGCPKSDSIARRCLHFLKPELKNIEEDYWEELDNMDIAYGAQSLRWLIWPKIDEDSKETFATECPKISINPTLPPFGFGGVQVPHEALPDTVLDDIFVSEIDPKTWTIGRPAPRIKAPAISGVAEVPIAERFRLAFVERDARLAPKRAKNARQRQRRAEREWATSSTDAKSLVLASQANKFLHKRI